MQAETPSLVFMVLPSIFDWRRSNSFAHPAGGRVEKQAMQAGFASNPRPTPQPRGSLSLSCLTHQSLNPTKHKLLNPTHPQPPTPQKNGAQVQGGGGAQNRKIH